MSTSKIRPVILWERGNEPKPRYGNRKPHAALYQIINKKRNSYKKLLQKFLRFGKYLRSVPLKETRNKQEPCWINSFLPALDAISLYSFIRSYQPKRYFEIGSGYSTRWAKKAIQDHGLSTKITSIDPHPRTEVNRLCDVAIRRFLCDVDIKIFDQLKKGDVLFVDGSHRCFMNSDVAIFFLDILPRLKPGVLVQLHDICLPYDYPSAWKTKYYSEQYLLAVSLLARDPRIKIILPNSFISHDSKLHGILSPLMRPLKRKGAHTHGASFWMEIV